MFPAIFAVLLLGHFVAAEIYVGQNPENVNAVIKDANGNLVPVTGVADEIVVVDLNYGGEGNSSGMSVDVSVSPVNETNSGSTGYPPSGYQSSISLPSGSSSTQIPNSSPSASSISLPSASESPPIWNLSSAAATNQSSTSSIGSSSPATGGSLFSNSGLGLGLNVPTLPTTGTSTTAKPTVFNPFAEPPSKSSSNGSKNKNKNPFNIFGLGGRGQNRPSKNTFPAPSLFVELGGSLGPVVDPVNLTPVNVSDPFVSNITTSTSHKKHSNKNNPFFNVPNMMMNLSSPFQFPPNTNATPLNGILGSLFNSSTIQMQPVNDSFMPLTKMMHSFMNSNQSVFNHGKSNASPLSNLMNSFMNPSALLPHFGDSSTSSLPDLFNSFMNSSSLNSSSSNSSFDDMMNSFFQDNPSLFNQSDGSLSPLTDMMNSIMNATSSLFNMNSSTESPFANMMNSFSSTNKSPFPALSGLFSPDSSPFSNLQTSSSDKSLDKTLANSKNGNGFLNSMLSPTDASAVSNLMSSVLGGTSGNSTNLKGMLKSFLPPSMLGESDDEENDPDHPDDDIYKDLNSGSSDSDSDDEDYYNPLPSLLPPKKSSSIPSLADISGSDISSELPMISGVENMVNNLLTPAANGTTPLTSLLNGVFGANGTAPSLKNPFAIGNLLNPMTFMNGTSFNLTSALKNYKPFSNFQRIISSLNSTGLFGNLSGVSGLLQNLSSIVTQGMNNKTKDPDNFDEILQYIMSLWQNITPILQSFMKNIGFKPPTMKPSPQSVPLMHSSPSASLPMPLGIGTSFLALPTSLPAPVISEPLEPSEMQASAPAPEGVPSPVLTSTPTPVSPETSTSHQPTTAQNNSTDSGTSTPTPPTNTNGTETSPNAGGINLSSIWITLIGSLFVAFSQKSFLGLM